MHAHWSERRVLVTGAGGFIGSHLTEALLEQGARVTAFVHYNSRGDPGWLPAPPAGDRLAVVAGDLRDLPAVEAAVREHDTVFHLGALISIPYSYRHPAAVAETNVMGTLNVLMACRAAGVRRLVHTSSSEVYGTARRAPMPESHVLQAQSPYAATKIAADKLAESFFCAYGLPVVVVRPFNTYGPRQSARAVIPAIIAQALSAPVVQLGYLEARRDFTYVADTVAGFLRAAEVPGIEGQCFNLGTGVDVTVLDLAQRIIEQLGRPVSVAVSSQRLRPERSEVLRLISDNALARAGLGWQPRVELDDGLRRTIDWVQAHLHCFRPQVYEV